MKRIIEPELMSDKKQAAAYANANFIANALVHANANANANYCAYGGRSRRV